MKKVNPKVIYICFIIGVLLIGGLLVFVILRTINKKEPEIIESNTIVNEYEIIEDMKKEYSDILASNGGTIEGLSDCAKVLNEYFGYISSSDYESAYDLYAIDLVVEKGYEYSLDSFTKQCEELRDEMGVDGETIFLAAHYYNYSETENYILVSLVLGTREGAVYGNPVSAEYTLIKVKDEYKILDFSYLDFDLYSYIFDNGTGGAVLLPELVE